MAINGIVTGPNNGITWNYVATSSGILQGANANFRILDVLVNCSADDILDVAPAQPAFGYTCIVSAKPTAGSLFSNNANTVAFYDTSGWFFFKPAAKARMRAFVQSKGCFYFFDGTQWSPEGSTTLNALVLSELSEVKDLFATFGSAENMMTALATVKQQLTELSAIQASVATMNDEVVSGNKAADMTLSQMADINANVTQIAAAMKTQVAAMALAQAKAVSDAVAAINAANAATAVEMPVDVPAIDVLPLRSWMADWSFYPRQVLATDVRPRDVNTFISSDFFFAFFENEDAVPSTVRASLVSGVAGPTAPTVLVIGGGQAQANVGSWLIAQAKAKAVGTCRLNAATPQHISNGEARATTLVSLVDGTLPGVIDGAEDSGYLALTDNVAGSTGTRQAVNPFLKMVGTVGTFDLGHYFTRFNLVVPAIIVVSVDAAEAWNSSGTFAHALMKIVTSARAAAPKAAIIVATHPASDMSYWYANGAGIVRDIDMVVTAQQDANLFVFPGHACVERQFAFSDPASFTGLPTDMKLTATYTDPGAQLYGSLLSEFCLGVTG